LGLTEAGWRQVDSTFAANGCSELICHGGAPGGGGGLDNLDDFDLGYAELLAEPVGCPTSAFSARVESGDPDTSFLAAKLDGTQDCGSPMPLVGDLIPPGELLTIRDWIAAGAPKN
jgi:hypothetical protein